MDVHGKRVLVFGLGLLGGGLATTKWLLKQGAVVRVTDRKEKEALAPTLAKLPPHPRLSFSLGGHSEDDVGWAELILVNPGVPKEHPLLALAKHRNIPVTNDVALFFSLTKRPIVAVTGTRGKTTVTTFIASLLSNARIKIRPTGNSPENPLLQEIARTKNTALPVVAELSSWQLEFLPVSRRAPRVAVITNLFPDHLNRYQNIEEYADAKSNIFLHQKRSDTLVVRDAHPWTPYFLDKRPKGRVLFTALHTLPKGKNGVFVHNNIIIERVGKKERTIANAARFRSAFGEHNLMNLLQAIAAAHALVPRTVITERRILLLRPPPFRQEVILKRPFLSIVNDTTATSPDGTIAAIERFSQEGAMVLITGGTDKHLEMTDLARTISAKVPSEHLVLLNGSATAKLVDALRKEGYPEHALGSPRESLAECFSQAMEIAENTKGKTTVVFSPGSASFEKFKNEFDRGEQFNAVVRKCMR